MVGFEKALEAVKVMKNQVQYRSQGLLKLARGYFTNARESCADNRARFSRNQQNRETFDLETLAC